MSPRTRLILAVLGAVVVAGLVFFFLIRPRQTELAEIKEEIATEQARTQQLQAELTRLEELRENAPKLLAELAEIREFVPPNHQVPNFIFLVQAAANASGVDFLQITPTLPEPPLEGAAVAQVRITLGASGGYFAVQDFIRRLYNLDRAVRLDHLSLNPLDETVLPVKLTMTGDARIFFEVPVAPIETTESDTASEETETEEEEA